MTRPWLVLFLLGSLCWSQTDNSKSAVAQPSAVPASITGASAGVGSDSGDKPLITVPDLCDPSLPESKARSSDCKTVITRAQFEKIIDAVQPNMPARARREFALNYVDTLVMARKAEQMGLDKGTTYEEQMRIARMEVLSRELAKFIQEKASQITDEEIKSYYQTNRVNFEKAEMDRIYVPGSRRTSSSAKTLSPILGTQQPEQSMKDEAENLRMRAIAGEGFDKLQADAYRAAGITSTAPNARVAIRRTSLPSSQLSVMELKPGEISPVLTDPNGYVIYRVITKSTLPLDQVRDEIMATLRIRRTQDQLRRIEDSATPILDESYFIERIGKSRIQSSAK